MLTRIRPLDLKVTFQDRPYKLGETIDLTVDLVPKGNVEVREARVDLVCEESYTEVSTVEVPVHRRGVGFRGGTPEAAYTSRVPTITKQVSEKHKVSYVHSHAIFLKDAELHSGEPVSHKVKLSIQAEPPHHADVGASVRWKLVTTVDVARARDVTKTHPVKVVLF